MKFENDIVGDLNGRVDNADRRLGFERRQFSYTHYIPERRKGKDRRCRSAIDFASSGSAE